MATKRTTTPPVQTVACSTCDAQPGEDCTGPGMGWHLNRWDRWHDTKEHD